LSTAARWIRTIVASVVVLIVLGAAGLAAVPLIQGTWQVNPVVSGSMRPGFAVGGVVISERIPVDQLALRDVMVFRDPNNPANLMVHRIVQLTKNKSGELVIKTQGDANDVEDPWTLTISGKYAYVVRWSLPLLGYAAVAYQNHRGLVLLGAGILLILIAATTIFGRERDEEQRADEPDPKDPPRQTQSMTPDSTPAQESRAADEPDPPRPTQSMTPDSTPAQESRAADEPDPPGLTQSMTPDSNPAQESAAAPEATKVISTGSWEESVFHDHYDDDYENIHSKDPPTLEEYTETRHWNDRY
jgi:signal peptidase I